MQANVPVGSLELELIVAGSLFLKAFASSNTVGVIPFYLSGGISTLTSVCGFGSDSIISARVVTATGTLIVADTETNVDLLWALKGAGQFFGVVIELTIRTHPLSILGSNGKLWNSRYIFPVGRAEEVCAAMEKIMFDETNPTVGHLTVIARPLHLAAEAPHSTSQALLVVSSHYLGAPENGPAVFKALEDLRPSKFEVRITAYEDLADQLEYLSAKGGYKRFNPAGIRTLKIEKFAQVISIFLRFLKECPDAGASGYHLQWHSRAPKQPSLDSAMSHHDVQFWL